MTVITFVLATLLLAILVLVASMEPKRARLSEFELKRRQRTGDVAISQDVQREALYVDIVSIQRALQAVLLVMFVLAIASAFGWLIGGLIAVVISLTYGTIAGLGIVRKWGTALYEKYETSILTQVNHHRSYVKWLRSAVPLSNPVRVESREELAHLVSDSQGVIADDEKKLILASLTFEQKLVHEIMTPKSVVDTVKRSEVLGPLVLDDLHKTGHSRFPVIDEDIDHVVGILYVRDVLTLDTSKHRTAKVETAMSKRVYYIKDDHTLEQALTAFLSTHHHLFIVINEFRETVGIITLEDTIEALLGRKIIDEFDAHDDMRLVASRKAHSKSAANRSTDSKDV